ncbi:MAG: sugar phosphate isomerase/epimerase [Magnetospirillum sp.]|nr:sugar phosphate isomerase/epimerase [Magnetospirillum sp.]
MKSNDIGVISMFYARPFGREHLPLFARARKAGMDFVELLVPEPGELDLAETRRTAAAEGVGLVLAARVNLQRDLASPEAPARAAGLDYLRACVDVAVALGAKIVGGPLYGAPLVFAGRAPAPVDSESRARRIGWIVQGLREAAAYAVDRGIVLGLEPLNRFETDVANTTDHALEIVEAVNSPALGAMLDTFHMNMEDRDIAASIRKAGHRLVHFQANENHRGFLGDGHIDWPSVARALVAINYRGPITLEPFRRDDVPAGTCVAQWRAPHRDEDRELSSSAALLRACIESARRAI